MCNQHKSPGSRIRRCIYCGLDKPVAEFSLEHIWPDALGGRLCPDLFKTRQVCQRCNNLSGLWVDGAFLKSWFLQNEHALTAETYMDPERPGITALTYLGADPDFPCTEDEVCERWAGPAGEHIHHVHKKDREDWFGYAGGDIIRRRVEDGGRAYLQLTAADEYWVLTALASFAGHFRRAKRCCLTEIEGYPDDRWRLLGPAPDPADADQAREIAYLLGRRTGTFRANTEIKLDFSDRFLAKLGLALGHNLFGAAFSGTPYAQELWLAFRERDRERRATRKVRGVGFFGHDRLGPLPELLNWRGAWSIMLHASDEDFSLGVCTPSGRLMTVVVSDEPSLWSTSDFDMYWDGVMFLVIPQRGVFHGPIPLPDFLAHRTGVLPHPDLTELEALRINPGRLPSKTAAVR